MENKPEWIARAIGGIIEDMTRTLVSGLDAGVAVGGLSDQERVAQASLVRERDQTDWAAPSTHSNRQVGKLQTPTAASAFSETAPPSNHPRRRRGGGRGRKTTPPLSTSAGDLGEATEQQVGMPQPPALEIYGFPQADVDLFRRMYNGTFLVMVNVFGTSAACFLSRGVPQGAPPSSTTRMVEHFFNFCR